MRLLLDTQIAIWAVANRARLRKPTLDLLSEGAGAVMVSVVSVWEIAIKRPLAKRVGAPPFSAAAALEEFERAGFSSLEMTPSHAPAYETISLRHADPFDRMLIAQAVHEGLTFLTADRALIGAHACVMEA